ncbi:MAG: protein kinase domain-containing protein [Planctomycetota bacterium]|jgi:serine/threonine-protein kinase
MSDAGERNNERPNDKGGGQTRSFDGSAVGPGGEIDQFRIEQELGRGGAGVVYLAHDTKLDRSVAIKSLPAELIENPKARTRFAREARVLASLNHPNIATIYEELQEADGVGYLVLEYVAGQTLAERIARGGFNLEEALTIALQIAEAVAAAHEHDVIHRDLKPGNIKITPEGKVKVLDFGLAKALGGEVTDKQSTIIEPGRIIGTPAYMSPEQARGKPTDKRCDIWSFGCVLYEMLTGKVPFEGETVSDTLAGILDREPDWKALPQTIPANIQVLLRRCLEKDPRQRLRDIGDAGIEISETLTGFGSADVISATAPRALKPVALRRMMVWAVVCILIGATAATVITWNLKRPILMPQYRYSISLPKNQTLNEQQPAIAVSPDGKRLVYMGGVGATLQLFLLDFDPFTVRELRETKGARYPFFSADGKSIGFGADGKLKTLSLEGGRPKPLCNASNLTGGSWGQDGFIYYCPATTEGLWKIPANGGVPAEQIASPDEENDEFAYWWPEVLPGGEAVLFTIWKKTLNDIQVAALKPGTRKPQILLTGASHARYAPTGHLLYAQSGTLMAAPFDLKHLKVGQPREPVIEGLKQKIRSGYAPFSFSRDGFLYYVRGGEWLARRNLVWVDRHTGDVIKTLPLIPGAYSSPCLSPNGQSIAFTKFDSGAENIWVFNLPKGPPEKVSFEGGNFLPIWKPDNNKLTFTSYRDGEFSVYCIPANKSSSEEPLLIGLDDQWATSWSPDGKELLFTEDKGSRVTDYDICLLSAEDANTTRPLICESGNEDNGVFSPDGKWIAYESDRDERHNEVYVAPYPVPVVNTKISSSGGYHPLWSPVWSADSKELFYRNGDKMIAVTIETELELKVSEPNTLFVKQYYTGLERGYDVSRDGEKFLMIKESNEQQAATQLFVVINWFEELKRLVPTGKKR